MGSQANVNSLSLSNLFLWRKGYAMRWVLMVLCSYELAALATSGRCWPTITTLVHQNRNQWWCIALVLAFIAWMIVHLLLERATYT